MRKVLVVFLLLVTTIAGFTLYGLFKPIPKGLSYQGKVHEVTDVEA